MNMTIAKITAVVMILVSVLCACAPINVEAASTYTLKQMTKLEYDTDLFTVEYYVPNEEYRNVYISHHKDQSTPIYIYYYKDTTTLAKQASGFLYGITFSENVLSYSAATEAEIKEILFNGGTVDFTETKTTTKYPSPIAYTGNTATGWNTENAISLDTYYYNYIYETTGEYPTLKKDEEEEESGGTITSGTIWDTIKGFWSGGNTFILDLAGEKINEKLADNKCFTSIISIRNTLTDLFNEDYTNPTGFYELGLTNMTLGDTRKVEYVYEGDSHSVFKNEKYKIKIGTDKNGKAKYQEIDFGLENAKVLNLDWYFGGEVENGYYKNGMKTYIDGIVSAFLWVMFAWALYKNMPNWISGELTQIAYLGSAPIAAYNDKISQEAKQQEYAKQKEYNNSYEAYKERMDRNAAFKQRYNDEKKGK